MILRLIGINSVFWPFSEFYSVYYTIWLLPIQLDTRHFTQKWVENAAFIF